MLHIEDNVISLTRGDTAYLTVEVDGYEKQDGDTISLVVKKKVGDTAVLTKSIPLGEAFVIMPADTKDLDYGKYVYDIQIDTAKGEVFTVIEKTQFKLTEEVNTND